MNFYQIFLPAAMLLYLLLVFVVPSLLLWKRTGVNPFVFGQTDKAHDYVGRVYKVVVVISLLSIGCFSFFPSLYGWLVPIAWLEVAPLPVAGAVLLVVSFTWTALAQYHMARSWRIGINYAEKTALIRSGLFRISRNPVFLGLLVSYGGLLLVMPNALSLAIWAVMYVTIQLQVRLEEEYLESIHGATYREYKKSVRRWL